MNGPASRSVQLEITRSARGKRKESIDRRRMTEVGHSCLHMNLNLRFKVSVRGAREAEKAHLE